MLNIFFPWKKLIIYSTIDHILFVLENIPVDESSSSEEESMSETFSSEDTLVTSKRKRFPSTKLRFYESEFELPALKKEPKETERVFSS